jgi:hypothetical protein
MQVPTTTNRFVGCRLLLRMRHTAENESQIEGFTSLANAVTIAATKICSNDQYTQLSNDCSCIQLREKLSSVELRFGYNGQFLRIAKCCAVTASLESNKRLHLLDACGCRRYVLRVTTCLNVPCCKETVRSVILSFVAYFGFR